MFSSSSDRLPLTAARCPRPDAGSLFVLACVLAAGCALREAPSRSGSPLVEAGAADPSGFPIVVVEMTAPAGLAAAEFHADRPDAGPLDGGVSIERVEPAGPGRYRIALRDADLDPDRLDRSLLLGYRRDAPPHAGARTRVAYRVDSGSVRAEFDRALPSLLAELAGFADRGEFGRGRRLADAIARHAPDRPELDGFDRRHLESLLAADRDRDGLALARRLARPDLDALAERVRALLAARAERTALDWLAWLVADHGSDPRVEALAGPAVLEHYRDLLERGEHARAAAFAQAVAALLPAAADRWRRLEAQAHLRRALALHSGRLDAFPEFVAEVERARDLSPEDPTLPGALAREAALLLEVDPAGFEGIADALAGARGYLYLSLDGIAAHPEDAALPPAGAPSPAGRDQTLPDGRPCREFSLPSGATMLRLGLSR